MPQIFFSSWIIEIKWKHHKGSEKFTYLESSCTGESTAMLIALQSPSLHLFLNDPKP